MVLPTLTYILMSVLLQILALNLLFLAALAVSIVKDILFDRLPLKGATDED